MNKQRGFTLLELLITLAVLAIMVSMAVPSFRSTIERNQVLSTANDLLADLQLARSEAIKQDRRVDVCASSDAQTCTGNWTDGWIVIPVLKVGSTAPPPTPISIREQPAGGIVFTGNTTTTISYLGTGRTAPPVAQETIPVIQGAFQYDVITSVTGRPRVKKI